MTKLEFLDKLASALKKNGIRDADEILGEYEEHFAFKLADGFTEAEIAEKLGDPAELASQFEAEKPGRTGGGRRFVTALGLVFADIFAALCFVLLWAFEAILAAATAAVGALSVCLLGGLNIHSWIPPVPRGCGVLFGLSFAALAVLAAVGCVYVAAYLCQLLRAYVRFHRNALAAASGKPVLPPVQTNPRLPAKTRRTLRQLALGALAAFAVLVVLAMIVSAVTARALPFWHAWGWFGYTGWN